MNVGVLGSGFIIPIFIENTKRFDDYHLRAIWGRHQNKLDGFAKDFDYTTTDIDKFMADKDIDVVYVGLPNGLHYQYALMALKAGKHVICEKPFCATVKQAEQLFEVAKENNLLLFEAIMTEHSPNYLAAGKCLDQIGDIRIVEANFSQYSRRYDRFKNGDISPAFDSSLAGGALMDLGVYNIHYVVGMLGRPEKVMYYPNIVNGVDTSGILILDYGTFKASLIHAKDCGSKSHSFIEGDKGYINCEGTSSRCAKITVYLNNGEEKVFAEGEDNEFMGMQYELAEFARIYKEKDFDAIDKYRLKTMDVQYVLQQAMISGGLNYQ